MRKDIRVVFMGTPEFAVCSLKKLNESGYNIVACFTNPDKPSGRGMKLVESPVKAYATLNKIDIYQPLKIKNNEEVINKLKYYAPDVIVVVAYGKILPKEVLEFPRLGAINVHGSLLPKYRGAAPIQWAVINGEKTTGVTTMFMDEGMDTGDMLLKEEIDIAENDDIESIYNKLKEIGANLLITTLDKVVDGSIERKRQIGEFCLAPMIRKEMTKIDFSKTCSEIYNFVRGLSAMYGTFMKLENGNIFKVYKVEKILNKEVDFYIKKDINENGQIVYISKDKMYIKCKDGYISILSIQAPNSKRMDIKAFLAGSKLTILDRFI